MATAICRTSAFATRAGWEGNAGLRWLALTRPAPATATATAVPAHAKGVGRTSSARIRQMSAVAPARRARSAIASRGCALVTLPRPQLLVALVELGLAEAERRVILPRPQQLVALVELGLVE